MRRKWGRCPARRVAGATTGTAVEPVVTVWAMANEPDTNSYSSSRHRRVQHEDKYCIGEENNGEKGKVAS